MNVAYFLFGMYLYKCKYTEHAYKSPGTNKSLKYLCFVMRVGNLSSIDRFVAS